MAFSAQEPKHATFADVPTNAWFVSFVNGFVLNDDKGNGFYVRAVRAGS